MVCLVVEKVFLLRSKFMNRKNVARMIRRVSLKSTSFTNSPQNMVVKSALSGIQRVCRLRGKAHCKMTLEVFPIKLDLHYYQICSKVSHHTQRYFPKTKIYPMLIMISTAHPSRVSPDMVIKLYQTHQHGQTVLRRASRKPKPTNKNKVKNPKNFNLPFFKRQ